jgi:DNA polymerase III epsilon subunit-like protein
MEPYYKKKKINNFTDVMIDIETLSTKNNALILTIGAIKFNKNKDSNEIEKFYYKIDRKSCELLFMHVDKETIKWWKEQPANLVHETFIDNKNRININDALIKLSNFIKDCNYIWANSPNFDCVILENAYNSCKLEVPWKFWQLRDTRTVYDLGKIRLNDIVIENNNIHNALDDCYKQIIALKKSFENLKIYC